jgi:hypothetical protein
MSKPAAAAATISLIIVCVIGALATAYGVLQKGFPLDRSPSIIQASIRAGTILAAFALWRVVRSRLAKMTLLAWIVAAVSSGVCYGLNISTTALQVVRATSHFFAFLLSAIVLSVGLVRAN